MVEKNDIILYVIVGIVALIIVGAIIFFIYWFITGGALGDLLDKTKEAIEKGIDIYVGVVKDIADEIVGGGTCIPPTDPKYLNNLPFINGEKGRIEFCNILDGMIQSNFTTGPVDQFQEFFTHPCDVKYGITFEQKAAILYQKNCNR